MRTMTLLILGFALIALAGCDRTESDWGKAKQANSSSAYRDFLAKHPQGAHVDEANRCIDDLDWKEALAKDTIEAYEAYLAAHAQGTHAAEATGALAAKRDDRDWGAAKATSTVEAVDGYLRAYTSGKHASEAATLREVLREDLAWSAAKSANTSVALQAYLAQYPSGRYMTAAKDAIEELAWGTTQVGNTVESYSGYLASYPAGKHANQAAEAIDSLDWQSAKAANTLVAWKGYIAKHKTGRFVDTATTLCEEAEWALAAKSTTVASLSAFIRDYPASRRLQEAKAMLLERTEQVMANESLAEATKLLCADTIRKMSAKVAHGMGTLGGTKDHPLQIALSAADSADIPKTTAREAKVEPGAFGSWESTGGGFTLGFSNPDAANAPEGVYVQMVPERTKVYFVAGGLSFRGAVLTKASVVAFQGGAVVTEDSADKASCSAGTTALLDGVKYKFDGKMWTKVAAGGRKVQAATAPASAPAAGK